MQSQKTAGWFELHLVSQCFPSIFSRMRTEGFLFSWEGVWGGGVFAGRFCDPVPLSMGNVTKGDVLGHVKVWQAWDHGTQEKVVSKFSNRVIPLSLGNVRKVMCWDMWECISRGMCGTLWHFYLRSVLFHRDTYHLSGISTSLPMPLALGNTSPLRCSC